MSINKTTKQPNNQTTQVFGIDPTLVRIGYAALSVFSVGFPGMVLYFIMAIVMPSRD